MGARGVPRACVRCLLGDRSRRHVRGTSGVLEVDQAAGPAGRLAGEGVGVSEILLLQILAPGSGKSGAWTCEPVTTNPGKEQPGTSRATSAWHKTRRMDTSDVAAKDMHASSAQARSCVCCMPYVSGECWPS
jgi:hypothetical protein